MKDLIKDKDQGNKEKFSGLKGSTKPLFNKGKI